MIARYTSVEPDAVTVNLGKEDKYEVLELSIALHERE